MRSANAVGQWISRRSRRFAPQSRPVNIAANAAVNASGLAVDVWAPLIITAIGTENATRVAIPSSHQRVPFRYS